MNIWGVVAMSLLAVSAVRSDAGPPPPVTVAIPVGHTRYPFVAPPGGFPTEAIIHEGPRTILMVPDLQLVPTSGRSMIPIIPDPGLVLVAPIKPSEVQVGMLIWANGCVFFPKGIFYLHQVWRTGEDAQGWFASTRGLAVGASDLCAVRAETLKGYVVAVLYGKAGSN